MVRALLQNHGLILFFKGKAFPTPPQIEGVLENYSFKADVPNADDAVKLPTNGERYTELSPISELISVKWELAYPEEHYSNI